jgi:hypothetical protein
LILVGLGIYFAINFKLDAFGEAVGMGVLGLVAIGGGMKLVQKPEPAAAPQAFFDWLRREHGKFGLGMVAVGLALALAALYFIAIAKVGPERLPQTGGMLLLGLTGLCGGVWLVISQTENLTVSHMRGFVLLVGGAAGFILALAALAQAIVWRSDITGGMRVWQGATGWRLWLCAYVELAGLALMFGSLLLARTDVRANPVLRRLLYGYNAVLTGLLLLAILAVANIVLFALFPFSLEWSKSRGAHTLSITSKNLLASLREPTTIYVFPSRESELTPEVINFLDNCKSQSTKVQVKYVNPDKDFAEYKELAQRFPDSLSGKARFSLGDVDRGILIVYGDLPSDPETKVPHAFLSLSRLVEQRRIPTKEGEIRGTKIFKGEQEIMTELSFLAQNQRQRKVYFLQGDGELDINNGKDEPRNDVRKDLDEFGCELLIENLKREKMEIQGLSFAAPPAKDKTDNIVYAKETGPDKRKEVPADADAIVIGGASTPLDAKTLDALERYMDAGGRMVVFLDLVLSANATQFKSSGLEPFLRKYGVLVSNEFALAVSNSQHFEANARWNYRDVLATVPRDSTNQIAKAFARVIFPMDGARIVRPDPTTQKYKVEVLLHLDWRERAEGLPRIFYLKESSARAFDQPVPYLSDLDDKGTYAPLVSPEPLPVAVAVSEKQIVPGSDKESLKPRLVVFGDADCISNFDLRRGQIAYGWTASALNWMAEKQGLIGPRTTKESTSFTLDPKTVNIERIQYLPGWLILLSTVSLGAGIWVVRRR